MQNYLSYEYVCSEEYKLKYLLGVTKTHNTWLETYYYAIKDKKIIVGRELMLQLNKLIRDLENPKYIYDTTEADARILFMETCCLQSKAPFYNKPLVLMLWEKCFIECVYSFKIAETGLDRFKDILLLVSRKNGKSSLFAGDGMYDLFVGEGGQDICCASNDEKQAKLIWEEIKKMASKLDNKMSIVHRNIVQLENYKLGNIIFRMSAKSQNQDGRNISKTYYDESHDSQDDDLVMNCLQAMSIKDNPKFINCTTEGFIQDGYLDKKLKYVRAVLNDEYEDETLLAFLYTQDSENEIYQNKLSWFKSSPSLGVVKKWSFLEDNLNRAKFEKSTKVHVLCKDFNIKQNSSEAWLMENDYNYMQTLPALSEWKNSYCFGAVDLSATTDLTCAKVMFMKQNDNKKYVYTKYFIPESKLIDSDDKAAGAKYEEWARDGFLEIHEGNSVDLSKVAEWFYSLYTDYNIIVYKLGYDQRFAKDFLETMKILGMGYGKDEVCEMINQSKYVMSVPAKHVEADLKSQLIHGINDMDKWCLSNAAIEVDNQQNIMLVKTSSPKRIDGAVTMVILYAIYERYRASYIKNI